MEELEILKRLKSKNQILIRNPKDLYHISFNGNLSKLIPRLPYGNGTWNETNKYDKTGKLKFWYEPEVNRVSLSSDIVGAIRAVYPNMEHLLKQHKTLTMTVYKVSVNTAGRWVSPETLRGEGYIHDALVTQEWWALDSVNLTKLGKIKVTIDVNEKEWLSYEPAKSIIKDHSPKTITVEELY